MKNKTKLSVACFCGKWFFLLLRVFFVILMLPVLFPWLLLALISDVFQVCVKPFQFVWRFMAEKYTHVFDPAEEKVLSVVNKYFEKKVS